MNINGFVVAVMLLTSFTALAQQQVIYSETDRNDIRQTNFEILGKVGGNILIYKNLRDSHAMSVYDMEMNELDRVNYSFLPERLISSDFLAFPDFAYFFYQYQKRNIVYFMGVKINGDGKLAAEPVMLDTTAITFWANNKIYSVINSEDKQYFDIIKINTKDDDSHILTTVLYNKELELKEKITLKINMPDRSDYLTEFQINNHGDLAFARAVQSNSEENIEKLFFYVKPAMQSNVSVTQLNLLENYLDDLRIKPDNTTNRFLITSFFRKSRQGNVEGLFLSIWDNAAYSLQSSRIMIFDDNLRNEARGENGIKSAFNDFFIKNIIPKKDGGFLMTAEAFYTTGRGGMNRFNNMFGSPFLRPSDYYMFNPYSYGNGFPYWRYNGLNNNQLNRYHAENIIVLSFDNEGKIDWSNVLNKSQWDDETDALIGFHLVNTGSQLHFLFNQQDKRLQLLTDQSIQPDGKVIRNPTLKNLDRGYDFMPRYAKQVGLRQIIVPCLRRNFLCFARVEL